MNDEDLIEKWRNEEESDNNDLIIAVAYVADLEWIKRKRVPRGFDNWFQGTSKETMVVFASLIICFFSGNSVFLSQQISRNNISACFFSEANGSNLRIAADYSLILPFLMTSPSEAPVTAVASSP